MATTDHPTIVTPLGRRRVGIDPEPTYALHLVDNRWVASCSCCGYELAEGRHQERVERKAARRSCPICVEVT
jgi:hypothetical protein